MARRASTDRHGMTGQPETLEGFAMLRFLGSSRATSIFTAFAFLVALMSPIASVQAQNETAASDDLAQRQEEYRAVSETLDRFYAGVEVIDQAIDKSRFEIDALAQKLGPDPAAMLAFVQNEIAYEPYVGNLRGARGALGSRAANSLDRSLLLAALLQHSGYTVEIARGRLSEVQAMKLLQRVGQPMPELPDPLSVDAVLLENLIDATGMNVDELLVGLQETEDQGRAVDLELQRRVNEDEAFLASKLAEAGIAIRHPTKLMSLVPMVSEHFWIRYRSGAGEWVEQDPSFVSQPLPDTGVMIETTFAPEQIPLELKHELSVRMILRTAKGDTTKNHTLIEQKFPVSGLSGGRIRLANLSLPSAADGILSGKTIETALSEISEIATVLTIGTTTKLGKFFNASGQIFDSPPGSDTGRAERLKKLGETGLEKQSGTLETLFDEPIDPARADSNSVRNIKAQWVEYELISPTVSGTSATRTSVRSIYPPTGNTTSKAPGEILQHMVWSADLLPITGPMNIHQFGNFQSRTILSGRDSASAFLRQAMQLPVDLKAVTQSGYASLSLALFVTALTMRMNATFPDNFPNSLVVWDNAQLIAFESRIFVHPVGPATVAEGYDIVAIAPNIISRGKTEDATAIAIQIGSLANALERSLMKHRYGSAASNSPQTARNTGELMRAAIRQNVDIVTLKPDDNRTTIFEHLTPPQGERGRISEALENGYAVIAPVAPVIVTGAVEPMFGWWQVNLASGEIIGVMEGGRGSDQVESVGLRTSIVLGVGTTLACIVVIPPGSGSSAGLGQVVPCAVTGASVTAGLFGAIGGVASASIAVLATMVAGIPALVQRGAAITSGLTTPSAGGGGGTPTPEPAGTPSAPNPGTLPAPMWGQDVMVPGD
ncbi:MAG: hypothetical protein GY789_24460 [Hyphomicrobiales bacterium]|nr:hypothetical protein [Hyphomicrobiales bacterium]MCP5001439.1 hypothetical protein [Hyphomicrobiales bacterium]